MIYKQLPDGRIVPARDAQDPLPPPQHQPMRGSNPAGPEALRGVGDVVARATNALGIRSCDACKQRQELLNSMFPFGRR